MLKLMRKNTKLILWVLLILIIPPFVFWGVGVAMKRGKNPVVGIVFGKKIRLTDFVKASFIVQANMKLTGTQLHSINDTDSITWYRIILREEAHRQHMTVTKEELANAIRKIFSINGKFNLEYYRNIVTQSLNMSILDFETNLIDSLAIEKLTSLIEATVKITPEEVKQFYQYENEKTEIIYTTLEKDAFLEDVVIQDNLLGNFFKENIEQYRVPLKRNAYYVKIEQTPFLKEAVLTEKEIETYYQEHSDEFKNSDETIRPFADVKNQIQNLLEQTKAGQLQRESVEKVFSELIDDSNINTVAPRFNLTVYTTDFLSEDQGLPGIENSGQFTRELFATKLEEISDPVLVDSTYYILVPISERDSYLPAIEEVIDRVTTDYRSEQAYTLAEKKSQAIIDSLRAEKGLSRELFEKKCHDEKLSIVSPPPFSRRDLAMDYSDTAEIKEAAFSLGVSEISDTIRQADGPVILMVTNRSGIDTAVFEKEKDQYSHALYRHKKEAVLSEWYRDLLKHCKVIPSLSKIAEEHKESLEVLGD